MIDLKSLKISASASIRDAIEVIDKNGRGICFVIEEEKLVGIATDGDIRRGLLKGFSLDNSVAQVMNKDFIWLPHNTIEEEIQKKFAPSLKLIPLCDINGALVDVADAKRVHNIPILEPDLCGNELKYLEDCITTSWISSKGKFIGMFEHLFEEMHPGYFALTVSNGTTALHLALIALGIKPGDEVIVPNLTFAATINTVIHAGASPVICEVDPETWCIDVDLVKKLVTKNTKAIMPVHLYGHPCNMDSINSLAESHKLRIIEDCAEAIGSQWDGKPVGTFGDAATFSFFGNKTITTGEGGMILFRDKDVAERARILRDHGMSPQKRYWHEMVGYNYRLTNMQAAVGVAQLERFPEILAKKRMIACEYAKHLEGKDGIISLPKEHEKAFHSYWLYTIRIDPQIDRDEVVNKLLLKGIDTRPFFYPITQMPLYQSYKSSTPMNISEEVSRTGISLPSSVTLKEEDIQYICKILSETLVEMKNPILH